MMLYKPSIIKDDKDFNPFSCKIQVKTSDNTIYNHNAKNSFHAPFILKFNKLTHKTKGIYLMA